MEEERRHGSIEQVSFQLGEVSGLIRESNNQLSALNEKVAIQNGRVTNLEKAQAEYAGAIRLIKFFIICNIPVIVSVVGLVGKAVFEYLKRVG